VSDSDEPPVIKARPVYGELGQHELQLRFLGVGAMNSPRYAPAGLLVVHRNGNVMLDGGPGARPEPPLNAWLVTDLRAELIADIRRLARAHGLEPAVSPYQAEELLITPGPVAHTNHPTWGYLIMWRGRSAVWAPEFSEFPAWAAGAELVFADVAGWRRPIRFRGVWEAMPPRSTRWSRHANTGSIVWCWRILGDPRSGRWRPARWRPTARSVANAAISCYDTSSD
jgi:hypothetical protein